MPASTLAGPAVSGRAVTVVRGGRVILDHIDVSVPSGQVYGLLGPSGSGKTTLIRALVGVQRYAGHLDVLGHPAGARQLRGRIGYVSQAPSVYVDLTVAQNLRYFADVSAIPRSRVETVLAHVGLSERSGSLVGRLSGGEQTRVSLAAALLGEPRLLVLDEPTVGLDPLLRRDLWARFAELAAGGTTLVISSHVMDEAERCDQLLLLRQGQVLVAGVSPAELRRRTGAESVEAAFVGLVEQASATGEPRP
ncbi:ABC transporter ATP-binding protein [Acidothermaceae bacterium B102]|nr:ABC transporter ATP-binding protein [Acidothermaceae bacterium B102]